MFFYQFRVNLNLAKIRTMAKIYLLGHYCRLIFLTNYWLTKKKLLLLAVILLTTVQTIALPDYEEELIVISLMSNGLQYDKGRFRVKPGARAKLILTNSNDMMQNLVITLPGARQDVVYAALKLGHKGTE